MHLMVSNARMLRKYFGIGIDDLRKLSIEIT